MPFAYAETILRPEEIGLLVRVLNRICPVGDSASNDLERHETAFRLIVLFQSGVRDEGPLAERACPATARQAA